MAEISVVMHTVASMPKSLRACITLSKALQGFPLQRRTRRALQSALETNILELFMFCAVYGYNIPYNVNDIIIFVTSGMKIKSILQERLKMPYPEDYCLCRENSRDILGMEETMLSLEVNDNDRFICTFVIKN